MERKQRTLLFEETEKHMGLVFLVYGKPLKAVSLFRYLGRTLLSTEEDWSVVEWNLQRARGKWGQLTKILGREVEYKRTAGRLFVAMVQVMLLFGSETWVLTPRMEEALEGFHH